MVSKMHAGGQAQSAVPESRKPDRLRKRTPGPSVCTGESGTAFDCLPHTSLKQIQENIEIEADEAKLIVQPLLDTENTFVKDLDDFLQRWEALELRRKELLHRRWTQNVWNPIQKRIEQHVLRRISESPDKMRAMLERYLKYCDTKVFSPEPTDPLLLRSQGTVKEQSGFLRSQTGHVYNRKESEDPHMLHVSQSAKADKLFSSC
ncbi:protein FAM228A isoform X3 [Scleropages formosus]|uniref:protein FAM228A isoform X3 n=1 Tax=Scleropages formosus TaxID=113540 RepID=UPI000878FC5D|nr:protein FAM228B isoform X3 [Scleropages formosus]